MTIINGQIQENMVYNAHDVRKPVFMKCEDGSSAILQFTAGGVRYFLTVTQRSTAELPIQRTHALVRWARSSSVASGLPRLVLASWLPEANEDTWVTRGNLEQLQLNTDLRLEREVDGKLVEVLDFLVDEGLFFGKRTNRAFGAKYVVREMYYTPPGGVETSFPQITRTNQLSAAMEMTYYNYEDFDISETIWLEPRHYECLCAVATVDGKVAGYYADPQHPGELRQFSLQLPADHRYLHRFFSNQKGGMMRMTDEGCNTLRLYTFDKTFFLYDPEDSSSSGAVNFNAN